MAAQLCPVSAVSTLKGVFAQTATLTDPTTHLTSVTNTGGTDYALVTGMARHSIYIINGATNSVVFTVEGSLDGTNFETISYRLLSSGSYQESNVTVTGSSKDVVHISPVDYWRYLRVNVGTANSNGTTFTVYSET